MHNVLTQSFGFDGSEMASFYISNEHWEQGQEIALFDMGQTQDVKKMNETIDKFILIYLYIKTIGFERLISHPQICMPPS